LVDDRFQWGGRGQAVIDDGHRNAARDVGRGDPREIILVEAPPEAAVEKDEQRGGPGSGGGGKEIEPFGYRCSVSQIELPRQPGADDPGVRFPG
jgi:hypothetical protein